MKKVIAMLLMVILMGNLAGSQTFAKQYKEEMRAVWIATVSNIDFPKVKDNAAMQQEEFIQKLDELEDMGINTVMVQVRPKADALYYSTINPWSDVLTGVQGKYPGYDPLAFMIEQAHKRGMEIHAWLNPYRITSSGTDLSALSEGHPARLNPSWVMTYNNALYYNPEVEGVKQHIEDTIEEIIRNYNVDGIHFDDYFYPSGYPLPAGEGPDGVVANSRREHVNEMVRRVSEVIEQVDPEVEFGISPMGVWKNNNTDPTGSATGGSQSYYTVYADTRTWIQNEWIDYVVPQIYWETTHKTANYETLVSWWSNEVKGTDVKLYIGQGIYKDTVAKELTKQLDINKRYKQVEGSVYFSLKDLLNNRQGVADQIRTYYTGDVQIPEIPSIPEVPSTPEIPNVPEEPSVPEIPTKPELPELPQDLQITPVDLKGIVTGNNLNIRSGPGTQYTSLGKVHSDTVVDLTGEAQGWYKAVLADGTAGWLSSDYVAPIPVGSEIKLVLDGKLIVPPVAPVIRNETTLVPLRVISENLKALVDWNKETKMITITKDGEEIKLVIGSKVVWANGNEKSLTTAPTMIEGTTMVPIRFISENLGASVDWNSKQKIVSILSN